MPGLVLALVVVLASCSGGTSDQDAQPETPTTPTGTTIAARDVEFPDTFDPVEKDTIVTIASRAVACKFSEQSGMPFATTAASGGPTGSVTCQSFRDAVLTKLAEGAPPDSSGTSERKVNGLMTSAVGLGAFVVGASIEAEGARVLQPGEAVEYDGAQCVAADDGVRCQSTNEPGFVLSETGYRMLKS